MTPVRDLLERLVAFDTITERGTGALIDFVATHLSAGGGTVRRVVGEDARRVSLVAQTPAAVAGAGVMFAGHADVVPTEGQAWSSDPFRLVERDGKLYGRGAADMKGFLAIVLSRFADWTARGIAVTLVITHDEEVSCRAVREVLAHMTEHNRPLPRACVVGEPTGLRPVDAHKSKLSFRCDVTGRECHSALAPEGVNAVEIAAELVVWLRARAGRFAVDGPFDPAFSPPHTTLQTGILRGGTAVNIVPNRCSFEFDLRALPGVDGAAIVDELRSFADSRLLPGMKAVSADADIRIVTTADYAPLEPPAAPALAKLLERLTGVRPEKVAFATEAGFYQQAGIDTVVCGPGSIAQAHRPDEFVEKEHLERCGTILDQVASHYSS